MEGVLDMRVIFCLHVPPVPLQRQHCPREEETLLPFLSLGLPQHQLRSSFTAQPLLNVSDLDAITVF